METYIPSNINIYTKLVGVTFNNRQSNIMRLKVNDKLRLIREPNNIYDTNAILVCDKNFNELGHISKNLATTLAPILDAGKKLSITVQDITGTIQTSLGVNVFISNDSLTNNDKFNNISFNSFSDISTSSDDTLNNFFNNKISNLNINKEQTLTYKLKKWKILSREELYSVLKRSLIIEYTLNKLEIPMNFMIDKNKFIEKISTSLYFIIHNAISIDPSSNNILSEIRDEMELRMSHNNDNPFINLLSATIAGILSYKIFNLNISFFDIRKEAIDAAYTDFYQILMDKQLAILFIIINSPDFDDNIQKII